MQIDERIIRNKEKVIFKLRGLYIKHGYTCFKMSKFEEYELYSANKDFLLADSIITFTNTNGRLMALKPDVTLSIVKNYRGAKGTVQRLYYNENVYRTEDNIDGCKEITQAGIECLGNITLYNMCEVVNLAAASLATVSRGSVLNISHLGIISKLLKNLNFGEDLKELLTCIGSKNGHGISQLCKKHCISPEEEKILTSLTTAYGKAEDVIKKFRPLVADEEIHRALDELETVACHAGKVAGTKIFVDLSLISNLNYYNGLMFQGYIKGIPSVVLSGGQYDSLMEKMDKNAKAIGFAVYLDQLDFMEKSRNYDADVLLLYDEKDDIDGLMKRIDELTAEGKNVSAQTCLPDKMKYAVIEKYNG